MKKILAIAMAIVMMMAIAVPAFAADLSAKDTDSGEVIITTSTDKADGTDGDWYLVTIPANTTIAWGETKTALTGTFAVETHLLYGKTLDVNVTSADYVMTYEAEPGVNLPLEFRLIGDTDFNVSTVQYPAVEKTVYVEVTEDAWNNAVVGEYADTLTFSAAIV